MRHWVIFSLLIIMLFGCADCENCYNNETDTSNTEVVVGSTDAGVIEYIYHHEKDQYNPAKTEVETDTHVILLAGTISNLQYDVNVWLVTFETTAKGRITYMCLKEWPFDSSGCYSLFSDN